MNIPSKITDRIFRALGSVKVLSTGALTLTPGADSTTAVQVFKADGTTPVVVVDTTGSIVTVTNLAVGSAGGVNQTIKLHNPGNVAPWYMQSTSATFNATVDDLLFLGYNVGAVAAQPDLYHALEADYNDGTTHWMESYLEFKNANDGVTQRPVMIGINRTTGTDFYHSYAIGSGPNSKFQVTNAAGTTVLFKVDPDASADVGGSLRVTANANPTTLTGSIDPAASTTVTGVGTKFLTELRVGDRITVTGETRTVTAIASDTSLTVDAAFSDNANDTSPDQLPAILILRDGDPGVNAVKLVMTSAGLIGLGGRLTPTALIDGIGGMTMQSASNSSPSRFQHVDADGFYSIGMYTDGTYGYVTSNAPSGVKYNATKQGWFGAVPVVQQTKAAHNNWAALSDVVAALVSLGFFDAA